MKTVLLATAMALLTGVGLVRADVSAQPGAGVSLTPLLPEGQPVGVTIPWVAVASGAATAELRYRFRVGTTPYTLTLARDFSPENNFRWTPLAEGRYTIEVSVWNLDSGEIRTATREYFVRSRVLNGNLNGNDTNGEGSGEPVLSPTSHPLVFLYSAPACHGGQMRVRFRAQVGGSWQHTPWRPCQSNVSLNFYIAGMRAQTTYEVQHEIDTGSTLETGPLLTRRTGALELEMPRFRVRHFADDHTSATEGVLLQSINGGPVYEHVFPVATDLAGNVIWYYRFRDFDSPVFPWHAGEYLVRTLPGGNMLLFLNYRGEFDQILREIDLAGHPVRETNVGQINRQLHSRGEDTIGYLHHEAVRIANGHTLLLGSVERVLNDVQGPGLVNVLGDMVIALDEEWQVAWTWNAFDHLDTARTAVLDEVCTVVTVGCPPLSRATTANDWTHANTIAQTPDGNLLISLRNQDWILKVDYRNGRGDGHVIWRLGKDGDFALDSDAPYPWFSHQHDIFLDGDTLAVYDNGNTRCAEQGPDCHSRGQVYAIDEESMTARLVLNDDLGGYSTAFGSAQKLSNDNYHFLSGILLPRVVSHSTEVNANGVVVYMLETEGSQYRSFRMPNLYTPVTPDLPVPAPVPDSGSVYLPYIR